MDCIKCGFDPCECRPTQQAPRIRDTSTPIPSDAITKDEFGLDLFEAIVCCGSILQLQQLREKTPPNRIKPKQLKEWQYREQEQKTRLRGLVPALSDSNAAELMRRYPFVAEL